MTTIDSETKTLPEKERNDFRLQSGNSKSPTRNKARNAAIEEEDKEHADDEDPEKSPTLKKKLSGTGNGVTATTSTQESASKDDEFNLKIAKVDSLEKTIREEQKSPQNLSVILETKEGSQGDVQDKVGQEALTQKPETDLPSVEPKKTISNKRKLVKMNTVNFGKGPMIAQDKKPEPQTKDTEDIPAKKTETVAPTPAFTSKLDFVRRLSNSSSSSNSTAASTNALADEKEAKEKERKKKLIDALGLIAGFIDKKEDGLFSNSSTLLLLTKSTIVKNQSRLKRN